MMVAIGIDLGTTNSCVAVFQNGTIRIIEDDQGKRIIPSVVTFTEKKMLVGFETYVHPESTIYEIKRIIGLKFDNENVKKHMSNSSCKFVNENNQPNYLGAKKQLSPEEISSEILKHLKQIAEKRLEQTITSAVVTVPAYFNGSQRSATKRAAEKAGFLATRIINEPTAAALSFQYGNETKKARKVLVYDFGGGTFDVTIADASKNSFVVLATDGDISLGGTDIDANILEFVKSKIKVDKNEKRMLRLKKACKEAKENLSLLSESEIDMKVCCIDELLNISRQKFEEINKDLFIKTMDIVKNCLSIAKLCPKDIDEVLLVGGSSRIPKIQKMLRNTFPRSKLNSTTNPDEDVARGAAIYAANLEGFDFSDVLSLSLGALVSGDLMSVIIPRNTRIPCEKTSNSVTASHNQTAMHIKIYQGESLIASKNQLLYSLRLNNIKIGKRGETEAKLTYKVDREGILLVTAEEVNANNKVELRVEIINSAVTKVNEIVENAEVCKDDELKYVKFATRKMEFQEFCEDLKLEHESTESTVKHKLFAEIDEALAKSSRMLHHPDKIDKLQSELKRFAMNMKNNTAGHEPKKKTWYWLKEM